MKTEKTLIALFIISLVLKLFDIQGVVAPLILILGVLSFIYFVLAFYFFSDKSIKQQNIVLSIVGGIILAIIPIGILFRILSWPGAQSILTIGIILIPILLIVCVLLSRKNAIELKQYYKNYIIRVIFWFIVCIGFYFTSSSTLIKIQYREEPELAKIMVNISENPDKIEYQNELDNYYRCRDSLFMDVQTQEILKQSGYK